MAVTPSSSFDLLHPILKQWIWEKKWDGLHDAQERAIPLLLGSTCDVLISASTAAGKTEAAFLPILSRLANLAPFEQLVLQISPLKALINDQFQRLDVICDRLDVPVVPWHGDTSATHKSKFKKNSRGVVLITPESLEALFVNNGGKIPALFQNLQYVVIDELHAFIGTERGRQLQSLLHRLELAIGRSVPRVGLSATLGDMRLAAKFMRDSRPVEIIESPSGGGSLKLSLKVFFKSATKPAVDKVIVLSDELDSSGNSAEEDCQDDEDEENVNDIARHLYKVTRDSKNLIFPNSRQSVEYYADALRTLCELDKRPTCYWPHHGSLSKELREDVERMLKNSETPVNAVCTSTLEMGVDIGDVYSVAQVGSASSVASLRQRLGRSGRKRGTSSILRAYALCRELKPDSDPIQALHVDLIMSIATIQLLIKGWFEPPKSSYFHLSTLVHQILSSIAQHTSRNARELWSDLIETGPHKGLSKAEFRDTLINLGANELVMQDADGALLIGEKGERFVNHYDFYTVFPLVEEYRVEHKGRSIGTLAKENMLVVGMRIVFAGRRWAITAIHTDVNVIEVEPARGGSAVTFSGTAASVHDKVIAEMQGILVGSDEFAYLDDNAKSALKEARRNYKRYGVDRSRVVSHDGDVYVFTWKGSVITNTLAFILVEHGLTVLCSKFVIVVKGTTIDAFSELIQELAELPEIENIFAEITPPEINRWDWVLPMALRRKDFLSRECNVDGARTLIYELKDSLNGIED